MKKKTYKIKLGFFEPRQKCLLSAEDFQVDFDFNVMYTKTKEATIACNFLFFKSPRKGFPISYLIGIDFSPNPILDKKVSPEGLPDIVPHRDRLLAQSNSR